MRRAFTLLLFVGVLLIALPRLASAQLDLSRYRGTNRLLLIFAPGKSDPRWQKQNALLLGSASAFQERNLLRFDFLESGARGKAAQTQYRVKPGQFRVLLVGKDGHVASSSEHPVRLSDLNAQIDRMPMRRDEMRFLMQHGS